MLVPNSNYCKFEDWIMPILDAMLAEQQEQGTNWTPSKAGACFCVCVCVWGGGGEACWRSSRNRAPTGRAAKRVGAGVQRPSTAGTLTVLFFTAVTLPSARRAQVLNSPRHAPLDLSPHATALLVCPCAGD